MPCFHINPVVDLPITIGSYPIQDVTPVSTGYPHPNTTPSDNTVSQQITASQVPAQNNYSTFTQSAAPIAPFPNDSKIEILHLFRIQSKYFFLYNLH